MQQREIAGLGPAFAIALSNWIYRIFLLDRYRGWRQFSRVELMSLVLFMFGGFAAWISELCINHNDLIVLQIFSAVYRATASWTGFVLIVNERMAVSRQQLLSFSFIVLITVLWEVQHRVVIS